VLYQLSYAPEGAAVGDAVYNTTDGAVCQQVSANFFE
jgi:hypothetical protein